MRDKGSLFVGDGQWEVVNWDEHAGTKRRWGLENNGAGIRIHCYGYDKAWWKNKILLIISDFFFLLAELYFNLTVFFLKLKFERNC